MKTVIELAREAGCGHESIDLRWVMPKNLERFAALVREDTIDNFNRQINQACEEARLLGHSGEAADMVQEPVAWILPVDLEVLLALKEKCGEITVYGYQRSKFATNPKDAAVPLYAVPVQPVKQEPVAWVSLIGQYAHISWGSQRPDDEIHRTPLYAAPVQQVDLTCQEVTALIMEGAAGGGWQGFATRVQTAFKEKNK